MKRQRPDSIRSIIETHFPGVRATEVPEFHRSVIEQAMNDPNDQRVLNLFVQAFTDDLTNLAMAQSEAQDRIDISSVWTDQDQQEYLEECKPDYALKLAEPGKIEEMLQLFTRNGRRHGNATIAKIEVRLHNPVGTWIHIVTDADGYFVYTLDELLENFELGLYVLRDFPNPKSNQREF